MKTWKKLWASLFLIATPITAGGLAYYFITQKNDENPAKYFVKLPEDKRQKIIQGLNENPTHLPSFYGLLLTNIKLDENLENLILEGENEGHTYSWRAAINLKDELQFDFSKLTDTMPYTEIEKILKNILMPQNPDLDAQQPSSSLREELEKLIQANPQKPQTHQTPQVPQHTEPPVQPPEVHTPNPNPPTETHKPDPKPEVHAPKPSLENPEEVSTHSENVAPNPIGTNPTQTHIPTVPKETKEEHDKRVFAFRNKLNRFTINHNFKMNHYIDGMLSVPNKEIDTVVLDNGIFKINFDKRLYGPNKFFDSDAKLLLFGKYFSESINFGPAIDYLEKGIQILGVSGHTPSLGGRAGAQVSLDLTKNHPLTNFGIAAAAYIATHEYGHHETMWDYLAIMKKDYRTDLIVDLKKLLNEFGYSKLANHIVPESPTDGKIGFINNPPHSSVASDYLNDPGMNLDHIVVFDKKDYVMSPAEVATRILNILTSKFNFQSGYRLMGPSAEFDGYARYNDVPFASSDTTFRYYSGESMFGSGKDDSRLDGFLDKWLRVIHGYGTSRLHLYYAPGQILTGPRALEQERIINGIDFFDFNDNTKVKKIELWREADNCVEFTHLFFKAFDNKNGRYIDRCPKSERVVKSWNVKEGQGIFSRKEELFSNKHVESLLFNYTHLVEREPVKLTRVNNNGKRRRYVLVAIDENDHLINTSTWKHDGYEAYNKNNDSYYKIALSTQDSDAYLNWLVPWNLGNNFSILVFTAY